MVTVQSQSGHVPCLRLGGGYPRLSDDIRRNLRKGATRLTRDRARAVIRFHTGHAALDDLRDEITAAYTARNTAAGRACDLAGWKQMYDTAGEAGLLRVGGQLAAWVLADPAPDAYRVLAGQMCAGFEPYRPGRLLEAAMIGRVLVAGWPLIDWGSADHASALIATSPPR